jgi:hypothetical protein
MNGRSAASALALLLGCATERRPMPPEARPPGQRVR